ncbi:hypothetical protein DKX38_022539 [Salix brachista]|uniref:Uncharacterized protein n=1 Tax=Salix brachista TaxID=2182728 RepID=A0A5N5K4W1_9ROSI|nr:hypothetical protein DKX38_022539 [Salix brachista]
MGTSPAVVAGNHIFHVGLSNASVGNELKESSSLKGNDAPLLERDQRTVKSRDFKDRVTVSKFMESYAFGSNANGPSGEEDVVND